MYADANKIAKRTISSGIITKHVNVGFQGDAVGLL